MKRKLFAIIVLFSIIPMILVVFNYVQGEILDSVRAYVRGEGLYAKAQNNAVHYLHHYIESKEEHYFRHFLEQVDIVHGIQKAREALQLPKPDRRAATEGFMQGGCHLDDVDGMIRFFLYLKGTDHVKAAIEMWEQGDQKILQLKALGYEIRQALKTGPAEKLQALHAKLHRLDDELDQLERGFSEALGEGARRLKWALQLGGAGLFVLMLLIVHIVARRTLNTMEQTQRELQAHRVDLERIVREKTQEIAVKTMVLENYFKAMQDGVGIADVQTRKYVDCNAAFEALTGYSKAEMHDRTIDMFFPVASRAYVFEQFEKHVKGEIAIAAALPVRHKNGTITLCDVSAQTYTVGDTTYNIGVFRDITERVKAEQKLLELNAELEKKVVDKVRELREKDQLMIQQSRFAALGEMISMIAHQWRQPLNVLSILLSKLQMMQKRGKLSPEELLQTLEKSDTVIQQMSATIDDFRAFFKPERETDAFVLQSCIDKACKMLKPQLDHHGITLTQQTDPTIEMPGAANEIEHILLILLSNARDAMQDQPGPKQIILSSAQHDAHIHLSIRDTGGGVPEAIIPRIFDLYFTTKHSSQGTGIGLHMAKTIITQHFGGTLEVRNVDGGAEFEIVLPLQGMKAEYAQSMTA